MPKQNKTEISDLVNEMIRRKTTFVPSTNEYLRYAFEFNCQLLEWFGNKPSENTKDLMIMMKSYIQRDLNFVNEFYHTYGRTHKVIVPDLKHIPEHIYYTVKKQLYLEDKNDNAK